jgi:hypothetical protein
MLNLHDDTNTLLHHETSKHDVNTTKGPVDSASAPDNSRPDTTVATTSISQKDDRMSIPFVINAAVETAKPIGAPVRHAALQLQRQNSNTTVVNTTLHGLYDSYTKSCPQHRSQNTSAQPVLYLQPANDYPKRRKRKNLISSGLKYSKEEDFFIAYCRIVKDVEWDQIEHGLKRLFVHRTKAALTCHCSEIRHKWGLSKAGSDAMDQEKDKVTVLNHALHFQTDFLVNVGFVHWKDRLELCKAAGRSM